MDEQLNSSKSDKMCSICEKNHSKYCCPRCNILYCSLDCYKSEKHMECSESFYQECVTDELAMQSYDTESKNEMLEILSRMQQGSESLDLEDSGSDSEENLDSDDEKVINLEDRIKDLDLNDADAVWNVLTEDEKNEFQALLHKGDISEIVPQWEPWWLYRKETKLVEEIKNKSDEEAALKKCPLVKDVPKLTSLTSVPPSQAIKHNIANVLASYVFVVRYFNGELDALESVGYLLSICANLSSNTNFEDVKTAIESVAQNCTNVDVIKTDKDSIDVMRHDTILLIKGPSKDNQSYYCKAALSHLYCLFFEAKALHKQPKNKDTMKDKDSFNKKFPEHGMDHLPTIDPSVIKKCLKKIEYYISYVASYGISLN